VRVTVLAAGFEGREFIQETTRTEQRPAAVDSIFGDDSPEGEEFEDDDLEIPDFLRS
jgi:hypothetical protein